MHRPAFLHGARNSLLALLCGAALMPGEAAAFDVVLEAPSELRALLMQHVRLLKQDEKVLPAAGPDRRALIRRTQREVTDLLATEGYFSPEIDIDQQERERWRLLVTPGPRTTVRNVTLSFEGELADGAPERTARVAELRKGWRLPAGKPFRQGDWDGAKQALMDEVGARRYAAARVVQSRATVDAEAATVDLSVTVDSGPPFFLGPLEVSGLQALPGDFVARFSGLEVGDEYDRSALLTLQRTLQNAPQFASVVVDVERDAAKAAAVPVNVQVVEARSRRLGFGAGFSSNTGYRVETTYRDVNLWRRGWELSSGLRLEQRRQSAYADIFLPPEGGHRDSIGALVDRSDLEGLKLENRAVGVARTTVRGDIETKLALRLQHEILEPDGAEKSTQNALTLNWTWVQRAVDDLLDPRAGNVLEFQVGGGSSIALAEQDFVRLYSRYVHYRPMGETDSLILRLEGGATLAKTREGIPQDFLFRAGGAQSVRGYAYQSLGVSEGDATVGGRYLGIASAEYVRWFRPAWGAAFFVDSGDAADSRESFRLHTGYGVGGRWRSPAGPLAVDLAWGQQDRRLRLHFGVAIAF